MQFRTHTPFVCVCSGCHIWCLWAVLLFPVLLFSSLCGHSPLRSCPKHQIIFVSLKRLCCFTLNEQEVAKSRRLLFKSVLICFFPALSLSVNSSRSMASTWSLALMRKLWVHMQVFIFHWKKKTDNKPLHPPFLCPVITPDASAWTPTCTPLCRYHLLYSVQLQSSCSLYSPPVPQST